ncbi:hypothetical protein JCM16418A_39530 [Paenibacillus pini]|uniref:Transcriptional regulator n=1 Tax=Paenibacillus pini JCM 16418 TaxID=1236976 RepID=W7Z490_9BACL|nr:transcriptional regulator [Paenibacillus pini JCM 16418]
MNDILEGITYADLSEIKQGYVFDVEQEMYTCLICGKRFEQGVMYEEEGVFYEAEKFTRRHIAGEHNSVLDHLLSLDKKVTGLTDLQRKLLGYFDRGMSDVDIVGELGGGSNSTIRNHRFMLREKMKQAKLFLAIMELVEEHGGRNNGVMAVATTKPVQTKLPGNLDQRFVITEDENEQILNDYFKEGLDGPLLKFPKKEKRKVVILSHLIKDFNSQKKYTEKEVNLVLKARFDDYVTLRRYLIEYGWMDRLPDGSRYWVKHSVSGKGVEHAKKEKNDMDHQRRKELVNEYMQTSPPMGVYQIRNTENGKLLVGSSINLSGFFNREEFILDSGSHMNKELQSDYNQFGKEAFVYETLEELKPDEQAANDLKQQKKYLTELGLMEEIWLEKLQPFDEKGYNKRPKPKKV